MLSKFADAKNIPTWAKGYVAAMVKSGYIAGTNQGLSLEKSITRGELAALFSKLVS